ncbi:RRM_1 domain-containing protein/Lsm_interact domain-containing protein, partial [Cephalotus follicularis]
FEFDSNFILNVQALVIIRCIHYSLSIYIIINNKKTRNPEEMEDEKEPETQTLESKDTEMRDAKPKSKSISFNSSNSEDDDDSSSSSDSDSKSVDEAQQNLHLQTLESDLSANPSNYDTHVLYIKLLREMGEIEKLRQAREAMSAIFPLTPAMWQEWANDEASLSTGPEAFSMIEKLYEQGVSDYLSVSLWHDYLSFIREYDPLVRMFSPDGILRARNLFERAIIACGLHVADGNRIWEAYREFEQAIYRTIDEDNVQEKEKQIQRIRSIFHRQLSVPLANLRSVLLAYKAWEVEQGNAINVDSSDLHGISSHVATAYQKALEMYDARVNLEEQISRQDISDTEKFQQYLVYLKFEESSGDPARIQVLYERAVTDFAISTDLWLHYTVYLDKTLKLGNTLKDVYSRATKNCPWVGDFWARYLLCLERCRAPEKEIAAVFEKSLQCTFPTMGEYLDLFVLRVDGLRRRLSLASEAEDVLNYSLIRETFQRASDYLSPHLKNTEALFHMFAYWARLELKLGKDLVASRGVWERLLKICGSMFEAWQGYISMERELGNIKEARSIYKRCYCRRFIGKGSEDICESWLRFERECGTLEEFEYAVQKVTPRMDELRLFGLQQQSMSVAESTDQTENMPKKDVREKRKSGLNMTDEQSPAKRQKVKAQNSKNAKEKDKAQAQNSVEVVKVEEVQTKFDKGGRKENQKKDFASKKKNVYTDQCTAFISNISLQANDEDLRQFFSDVGGVVSIRILHDKFTRKSRGLAYVDFTDDAHLAAAVAKNRQILLGKKLSIARSDPKQRKGESAGRGVPMDRANSNRTGTAGGSTSKEAIEASRKHDDEFQLKGKNTFAMPRNVKPLGVTGNKLKNDEDGDDKPKSNDEFRKLLMKK